MKNSLLRLRSRAILNRLAWPVLCSLLILISLQHGRADMVLFKDGFTLQGKIKREMSVIVDGPSGQPLSIPKGFFMVDDGARRIIFSQRQVQDATEDKDPSQDPNALRFFIPYVRSDNFKIPPGVYGQATPFNENWDRVLTLNSPEGRSQVPQHLTILTPYALRIDARKHRWQAHFLTREYDPATIRELLYKHPDLRLKSDGKNADRRFKVFSFLVQAGWYEQALQELDIIQKEFPNEKERVEGRRQELEKIMAEVLFEAIERAKKVGRHQWARTRLAVFPKQNMDQKLLSKVREMEVGYETASKNLEKARTALLELLNSLPSDSHRRFEDPVKAILAEVNLDNIQRLDAFLGYVPLKPSQGMAPEQVLALAVSGWLMGSNSAETREEKAIRLWQTRASILEMQRTENKPDRQKLIGALRTDTGVAFDELAQLIKFLPPPERFEGANLRTGPGSLALLPLPEFAIFNALSTIHLWLPAATVDLETDRPVLARRQVPYHVQLPPEYHPGRPYPVLMVLHDVGETPKEALQRWSQLAMLNGYLLVAPAWAVSRTQIYGFTASEQGAALDVLRDMRRRFQVDSDRVFLAGVGESGAGMAYDLGLAHPDQFAGVIPLGGKPRLFSMRYWRNAQNLSFYVVDGDLSAATKEIRQEFEQWVPKAYAVIYVEYKGRGQEWFSGELPNIFDWMSRKKRSNAFPDCGKSGEEFTSMRPEDNTFYWISADGINPRSINDPLKWKGSIAGAQLQGHIASNQVNLQVHGFKNVTIWLAPGMIDFEKPVNVYLNSRLVHANRKIPPDLQVLLENFYQTGDRQRLFLAKLELKV